MLICIKHPKYTPDQIPQLNCKLCCLQYVDYILENQMKWSGNKGFNAYRWLEEKVKRNDTK